jgi:AraC-like protein
MRVLLDTRDAEPAERFAWWMEGTSRLFFPFEGRPGSDRPFAGRVTGGELGPMRVFCISGDANECRRPARGISAGDPEHIGLHLIRRGRLDFVQSDRGSALRPGDLTVCDSARPFVLEAHSAFEMVCFSVPKALLGGHADRIAMRSALRVRGEDRVARLVRPFLASVVDDLPELPAGDAAPELACSVVALLRTLYAAPASGAAGATR